MSAGDPATGPYASTVVCAREECIADAKDWAETLTLLPASRFEPFPTKHPTTKET